MALRTEPRTRGDFLKFSSKITLDPNTASNYVGLSEGNRKATRTGSRQNYAKHPNRFTWWCMALSNEILTTPCYWEVERHGKVHIGVAYDTIGRTGADENSLGYGPKSWALFCTPSGYEFLHNGQKTSVSGPQSSRVGLFLDPSAGILSFYSVTHTMTLLHRVQTTFTEPLRAALWFYWDIGDNAEICNQGETSAVSGGPGVAGVTGVGDSTSREDFLRYSREITLDPNTARNYMVLSEGNRKATKTGSCQNYAEHPNRFAWWCMALSNEILTTPCYWEVELHGKVHIGVAYDTIGRTRADENSLGYGPKSWALFCTPSGYEFLHNGQKTSVSGPQSSRVGLFLDPSAGILSFYSVTHTMTLLHRVQTTFTEPLRAALWFYWDNGDNAEICNIGETSAVSGGPGVAGVTGVGDSTSREDFLRYSREITLDPNTASNYVVLSEGSRKATKTGSCQNYAEHPNRFAWWCMALSNEILTTPCYWEVERHGKVHIGVAYDTIGRTRADENSLGYGPKSWALFCTPSGYEFLHNGQKNSVSGPQSSRVGLFLDPSAGILSFYSVTHTMTLLHRVQTTFTEPLRAALWFYWDNGDNAEICNQGETSAVSRGPGVAGVTGVGDSTSRADFLRYSREITLDPNTARNYMVLSEGNRKATKTGSCQNYAEHPNRFAWWCMALSNEILTTPCYWEVELHGKVHIGVAYDTIGRTRADENSLGYGPKSWALFCTPSGYEFLHNGRKTSVSGPQSSRVGLFLDPSAGILSFYSVTHTMTLLHRVQTTFTEPLRAALWFYWDNGDNAEICNIGETSAVSGGPGVAGVTGVGDSTSREDFLRYSREITLDPNTARNYMVLSEGNRKATKTGSCQNYAEHPNRFAWWCMALSNEILTTPCYWEVELHGKVHIGVAYDTIGRTRADENSLGYGPKSWALFCTPSGYEFLHNGQKTSVSGPQSSRVGLFLDPSAGILSFYSVTHTMTLLHRVQTTFTEPLRAALWFYWDNGDNAEICNQGETSAVSRGPGVAGVTGVGDSTSRADFLRYSREITLDPNTARNYMVLSEGNRKATKTGSCQNYAEHPNRFAWWCMALSNEILTTPCYWEVELHGKVHIGVAYDTIGRTRADENSLGYGPKSWALFCTPSGYEFLHNGQKTSVSGPQSSRVGLFLDPSAGILSFYSVTHTMTLLHRVQTTFTEPLRAALWFYWDNGDNAEICNIGETSAVSGGPGVAGVTGVGDSTSREDFLRYSREITLDPNTARNYMVLSEGNRKATKTGSCQNYAEHPNRFAWWCMALSNEILTTPCYWEVELHGKVHIGVAYDTIGRTRADENSLGYGPKSWALFCTPSGYEFLHNGQKTSVSGPQSSRVGLFLDPSAGILSFYSVTHTMTLLHRVQTTFTEPLRAALWFYWDNGDNAEICNQGETSAVSRGPGVAGVTGVGDSTSRADFLRYSREITLDPNTARNYMVLSEGNRKATKTGSCQNYAEHPNRFAWWCMALSNEILTTPCYWEVELHGKVHIGVAYDTIGRTRADENSLGYGPKSWALFCTPSGYEFLHNGQKTSVSGPQSSRVGLFLDPSAGILSFYSVTHTMTLLHRVQTTFTEPLRAALWFYWDNGDNAEICNIGETSAVSGGPGVAGVTGVGDSTSRADFLRYSREITLDPNTARNYMVLSEGNRKATKTGSCQNYAEHPNRFAWWCMALSNEILTTPCYWEVELHGKVHIGVAYDTIGRTRADENSLGYGPKSWALFCTPSGYEFLHNGQKTSVSGPQSSRVGLFLDPSAGILSFYSVTHTMTLLHRVQTTFTEPLRAALWFYWDNGDNAEVCNIGETSAVSGGPGVAGVTGVGDSTSREDFLRYSREITLDPNTASNYVVLSEGSRKATKTGSCQNYAEHPNRFAWWCMALSNEILTTPCYWEVERHGKVHIGVAYDTIGRTRADENSLGYGPKSWALFCTPSGYEFLHNGQKTSVSGPQSSRVGLFLDPSAGILSFYSVTHTMTLLHRVQTTFTEPLRAALWFYWDNGDNAEICNQGETSAVSRGPRVAGVTGVGDSTSRADFLRYSREITLDPNTARNYMVLSEGNRKATKTGSCQNYAEHPNRFAWWCMALSNEILTTPCYWEVELHGKVHIGVAYDTIGRTRADENSLGYGPKSWALFCTPSGYEFLHNGQKTSVSGPQSSRVGLFLDPSAGILSFYSVTHTMTLLHRVQTTFTEPLRAALWFYWDNGDNAEICNIGETSAVSGGPGVAGVTGVGDSTSREDFLRYSREITLDPNTARNYMVLSEGNRKATKTGSCQNYAEHPNRFAWWCMALSNEILTTPCYWEVELHGKVHIGVAYDTIGRTRADENSLGYGPKSWALFCTPSGYEFLHNGQKTSVSGPQSSRVGLFLDPSAGILSFYSVTHTMTLLHRVQTTFTEPLRAALWFYWDNGDNAEICNIGETSAVSGGPGVAGVTGVGDSTSREDFLRYSREITLDPNTASNYVVLSEGSRKATKTGSCQNYAEHPNRFAWWCMALSNEILTTPCYWEVERHGKVHIGVAYDTIGRTRADENSLGYGPKSWALFCTPSGYEFLHNGQKTSVSGPQSSRVGLFLDPSAGILSFYSVTHTMTLLHRVQTTFTEPLRAALWFYWDNGDNAEICNQGETSAVSRGPRVAGVTGVGDSTSRADFLRYSREITLDPNTARNYMVLSEGNRKATKTGSCQNYAKHPNRFAWWCMALSNEILTTPCYWEVELHGKVHIGVAYDTIGRTRADENSLGYGPKSWALFCTPSGYEFLHNGQKTSVSGPQSPRVGLFLDPSAGILSFYSVTHTMTLLHRVQTTFIEPLRAAIWFYWDNGDNAEICKV